MDNSSTRSTTAEGAAFCRALGALERDAALRNPDHLARHFVTKVGWRLGLLPVARAMARRSLERQVPGVWMLHQARTRVFDDLARGALRDGASQLVVLGAGGDSRAYRFEWGAAPPRVFEVDHPETSAWKQACVRRLLGRLPEHVRYVGIDFDAEELAAVLARGGFDAHRPAFFLWEGVSMYLSPDAVDGVLWLVARSAAGSSIAFDYAYDDFVAHPERFEHGPAHMAFVQSRGEPIKFGMPADAGALSTFLAARGLRLARAWDHRALRAAYPGAGDIMPFVGLVHAGTGAGAGERGHLA